MAGCLKKACGLPSANSLLSLPPQIRRIKCDETKPACHRCTSTGRTCDGYEFPREQTSQPDTSALSLPRKPSVTWSQLFLPTSISASFPGDTQERRIFHRFQVCTVPAFAGGSETGFWESLLLKVGQQEPVVRNGIVALGTLHEDYQTREGKFTNQLIDEPSYQRALQLYGKALRQLNGHLHEGSTQGAKLAIISSILFACFEVLRRNNMAAVIHYQAGLRELTRQMSLAKAAAMLPHSSSSTPALTPIPQGELDELLRVFARYDIQACTFSKAHTERLDFNLPRVLPTSLTLPEVRMHLDNLLISVYQLVKSNLGMYRYWKRETVPVNWSMQKDEATVTFEAWLRALEDFFRHSNVKLRPGDVKSLLGLRLQIRVALIMLKTCIDCGPESSFDVFEYEFEDMIVQVEKMADDLGMHEGPPLDNEATPFTMDLGIIHPLFFIATKCRNRDLRRRAVVELRRAGREGVWEGPIMAVVADRIAQIEEKDVPWGEDIPERNRLHEIKKNVAYETRQVFVEATRARDDSWKNWETLQEVIPF